jgi:hypothetical protein
MSEARQTPLPDLLDRVPDDIVLGIPGSEPVFQSYTNIPIGRLAREAAAELRRLHAENEALRQIVHDFPPVEAELREVSDRAHRLEAQRDALLEALKLAADFLEHSTEFRIGHPGFEQAHAKARAAIKAVEGEKA